MSHETQKRYRYGVATGLCAGHVDIFYGDEYVATLLQGPKSEEQAATIVRDLNRYTEAVALLRRWLRARSFDKVGVAESKTEKFLAAYDAEIIPKGEKP